MTERNEILIQRCVDNELTAEQRRELLDQLDSTPDGWKYLACSFLENQLFADAAIEESRSVKQQTQSIVSAPSQHWFNRPLTSLVLSVCVAFLVGLLVRGEFESPTRNDDFMADNGNVGNLQSVTNEAEATPESVASADAKPDSDIKVRLVGDGMDSQVLPFYSAGEYTSEAERDWRKIPEIMNRQIEVENRKSQVIWLNINGQSYIIPVEEFESVSRFQ